MVVARRRAELNTLIPKPKKRQAKAEQAEQDIADAVADEEQKYQCAIINGVRTEVGKSRSLWCSANLATK
jgi:hypothetical protein